MKKLLAAFDAGTGLVERQGVDAQVGDQIGAKIGSTVYSFREDHRVRVHFSVTIVKCPSTRPDYFGEKRVWARRGQVGGSGNRSHIAYEFVTRKSFRAISQLPIEKRGLEFTTHKF
jgi:hypothetical protein